MVVVRRMKLGSGRSVESDLLKVCVKHESVVIRVSDIHAAVLDAAEKRRYTRCSSNWETGMLA
jgi:hypothetical protein